MLILAQTLTISKRHISRQYLNLILKQSHMDPQSPLFLLEFTNPPTNLPVYGGRNLLNYTVLLVLPIFLLLFSPIFLLDEPCNSGDEE